MTMNPQLTYTIIEDLAAERCYADKTIPTARAFDLFDNAPRQESGEVYFTLSHRYYDPEGVKISHRAGNFGHVRLLMRGAVIFMNRDQTRLLLGQWRRLTTQNGLASGWTIRRSYFSDHEGRD